MADSKELFLQSPEEEIKGALALVNSPVFKKMLIYSRSEFMQRSLPTPDQVKAINEFVTILINLPDEDQSMPEISSGIQHDMTVPDRPNQKPQPQPAS